LREPFAKFVESELGAGVLLITCGLPGTWKTETSEEFSLDEVRIARGTFSFFPSCSFYCYGWSVLSLVSAIPSP